MKKNKNGARTFGRGSNDQGPKPQGQIFIFEITTTTIIYHVTQS